HRDPCEARRDAGRGVIPQTPNPLQRVPRGTNPKGEHTGAITQRGLNPSPRVTSGSHRPPDHSLVKSPAQRKERAPRSGKREPRSAACVGGSLALRGGAVSLAIFQDVSLQLGGKPIVEGLDLRIAD